MIRRRVTTMTIETAERTGVGLGRGGRMSRKRKRDAVLRMLRGEDREILSRALGVTAATLSGWQDTFVAAGEASLATRSTDGEALENERLKAKPTASPAARCGSPAPSGSSPLPDSRGPASRCPRTGARPGPERLATPPGAFRRSRL